MRRRRRPRGTWLPRLGTGGDNPYGIANTNFLLDLPTTAEHVVGILPLTTDYPAETRNSGVDTNTALGYFIGNEYFLARIVGKVFASFDSAYSGGTIDNYWPAALLTCGLFVARAGDDETAGAADLPIGANTASDLVRNYNPNDVNTIREPWLWRRQWILGDPAMASLLRRGAISHTIRSTVSLNWPSSTSWEGSVLDGPHLDAKTKRRVGNDDRLWFAAGAIGLPLNSTASAAIGNQFINISLDARIFGSLRKARNRGTF